MKKAEELNSRKGFLKSSALFLFESVFCNFINIFIGLVKFLFAAI